MLESAYEGLNARPKVYLSKEYFCEMYPTCVSSKLCEFIFFKLSKIVKIVQKFSKLSKTSKIEISRIRELPDTTKQVQQSNLLTKIGNFQNYQKKPKN